MPDQPNQPKNPDMSNPKPLPTREQTQDDREPQRRDRMHEDTEVERKGVTSDTETDPDEIGEDDIEDESDDSDEPVE